MADLAGSVGEDRDGVLDARDRLGHARRPAMDRDNVAGDPARVVEVVDHQVEDDPARLGVIEEPVPGGLPRTEARPGEAEDAGLADRTVQHGGPRGDVLGKESHNLFHEQPDALLADFLATLANVQDQFRLLGSDPKNPSVDA